MRLQSRSRAVSALLGAQCRIKKGARFRTLPALRSGFGTWHLFLIQKVWLLEGVLSKNFPQGSNGPNGPCLQPPDTYFQRILRLIRRASNWPALLHRVK